MIRLIFTQSPTPLQLRETGGEWDVESLLRNQHCLALQISVCTYEGLGKGVE